MAQKERVLILCTGNSVRSQLAEGMLRHMAGDRFEVFSAGTRPAGYVHPLALQVLAELGVDTERLQSKALGQFLGQPFDYVLTVCDSANEECPFMPGEYRRFHRDFSDPTRIVGSDALRLAAFRQTRDAIAAWLREVLNIPALVSE